MFGHFNHHQLQRYIIAFGSFFTNIDVVREDSTGAETQRFRVPLDYGPKERWYARLVQDPDFTKGVSQVVPRMTYEMSGIGYDGSRHVNSLNQLKFTSDAQRAFARLYVGVPYTLTFDLTVLTKTQKDGMQILEQILPFFTPDLTFKIETLPQLALVDQIPLTLQSVTHSDDYEGDFEHRRSVTWNLSFKMPVFFYGPVKSQGRIEEVVVDIYNSPLNSLIDPPEVIATEDGSEFTLEDGSGHIMDESTPDVYIDKGRVARIDAVADPNQDPVPSANVASTTTITEYDGDVKRTRTFTDEQL